jgi:hypothetical protein
MLAFSNTSDNNGILQQVRKLCRVDANQWPTINVVNSCNNWKDFIAGYAISADVRFRWDDTNQTALPEGTRDLTIAVSDYSFLNDEQSNRILTLLSISILENGVYVPLTPVDRNDPNYDPSTFGQLTGTPTQYDKIADNIIRLNKKPSATVSAGLKYYFQRSPSYFTAASTTNTTGFSPVLDRGFVIASAYDCALTLGLPNIQALSNELQIEKQNIVQHFESRNEDEEIVFTPSSDLQGPMTTYF